MSAFSLVIALGTLAAGGIAPAWWAARDPVRGLFLILPAGVLVCGAGAALTLLFPGPFLLWWAVCAVVAAVGALWPRPGGSRSVSPVLPAVAVAVVGAATLLQLRAFQIDTDGRYIWFLHARLLLGGHHLLASQLTNPMLEFSHQDYPEGASGAVALSWAVTSGHNYRLGQLVIGILTAAAVTAFGFELARLGRRWQGLCLSTVVGVVAMIACSGPFERWASDGYVDPLWSALAVAAVVAGLIAPVDDASRRTAFLLAASGALTKNDGIPIGAVIVVLVLVRYRLAEGSGLRSLRNLLRPGRDLLSAIAAFTPLAAWMLATRLHGIHNRVHYLSGVGKLVRGDHAVTDRFSPFWTALWAHLPRFWWILAAALVASLLARRRRRLVGVGAQGWLFVVAVIELVTLIPAYLFDPGPIGWLVPMSITRTTIFLNLLGLALLAAWPISYARPVPQPVEPSAGRTDEPVDTRAGV